MDFVHQIRTAKDKVLVLGDETWEVEEFIESDTDLKSLTVIAGRLIHGTWLLPLKWNQGGYDLVCLLKSNGEYLLRFVQITVSGTHSLKLQHFKNLVYAMSSVLECDIRRIDIVMMLPAEAHDVKIYPSRVQDSGILKFCKVGNSDEEWKEANEHNLVRTLHFNKTV